MEKEGKLSSCCRWQERISRSRKLPVTTLVNSLFPPTFPGQSPAVLQRQLCPQKLGLALRVPSR